MRHSGDVLQRDPLGPLSDKFGIANRCGSVPQHHRPEPAEPHTEQVVRQEFRVDAGAGDPASRRITVASLTAAARDCPDPNVMGAGG
ncbi:hypothetical protein AHiyo4_31150 [Arthrobacter sp. Hiyo4]|nr:hypothetical protein AHiyo4_31150 [Arthrobacter sp. Hiyo4]